MRFVQMLGFAKAVNPMIQHWQGICRRQVVINSIAGCWDCDDAPCDKDVFALDEPAVYRAAIRCAKYGGPMELAGKIFLNQIHGICYPLAYFGCEDEQEARRLLDTYEEEVTEKVNNN